MHNRISNHPNRRLIKPTDGTAAFEADILRTDNGVDYEDNVDPGTPYDTASVLPDTTAESLGLDPETDPTPADALQAIAQALIVPLDIQELYKPLIAPLSVSLSGFVEGSYLYYGIPWDSELRIFVRVSKTTAMSGATAIGTLPAGYRPTADRNLRAYDTDGNIIADVIVRIYSTGVVSVIGNVEANVIVMAAYNSSSNSQSGGGLTYNDIDRLISQSVELYDTEERIIGTWVNGKPLYQKTVSFGALPNTTNKVVAHGISNLSKVIDISGYSTNGSGTFLKLSGLSWQTKVVGSNIDIITTGNLSSYTETYITLKYTKTTD